MADHAAVFETLSAMLRRHGKGLSAKTDTAEHLYLERPAAGPRAKPEFFGAVQVRKGAVSYHLMPVYTHPELLEGLSPQLRRRMQGKSCFNFSTPDAALFAELDALTRRCAATLE